MTSEAPPLSLADHACLALVAEGPTHGWELVRLLRPDGALGRIWSLSRPLTYRSITLLDGAGLIERTDAGRRTMLRTTTSGERASDRWLDTPVEHLRDLRTEFLLKLALRERQGRAPGDLAARQLALLAPKIDALAAHRSADPVEQWRRESALAARRFLTHLADGVADERAGTLA